MPKTRSSRDADSLGRLALAFSTFLSLFASTHCQWMNGSPWGMPQAIQGYNLRYGICGRPLAIVVCLEGSMARGQSEFRHMVKFAEEVTSDLASVQPRLSMMAINYCSYIKEWTRWSSSERDIERSMARFQWPYHYSPTLPGGTAPGGGLYPGYSGYGGFSVLQPNAGTCLQQARQALSQVPSSHNRLILHFTSGYSSNPLLTIQHGQAAMYEGTEIFSISLRSYRLSEEITMSVSGASYLLRVRSLMSLGTRERDTIVRNVCRVERRRSPAGLGSVESSGALDGDSGTTESDINGQGDRDGIPGADRSGASSGVDGGSRGGTSGGIDAVGSSGQTGIGGIGGIGGGTGGRGGRPGNGGVSSGTGGAGGGTSTSDSVQGSGSGGASSGAGSGGASSGAGSGGVSGGASGGASGGVGSGGTNGGAGSGGVIGGASGGGVGSGGTNGGAGSGGVIGGASSGGVGSGGTNGGAGSGGVIGGSGGRSGSSGASGGDDGTSGGTGTRDTSGGIDSSGTGTGTTSGGMDSGGTSDTSGGVGTSGAGGGTGAGGTSGGRGSGGTSGGRGAGRTGGGRRGGRAGGGRRGGRTGGGTGSGGTSGGRGTGGASGGIGSEGASGGIGSGGTSGGRGTGGASGGIGSGGTSGGRGTGGASGGIGSGGASGGSRPGGGTSSGSNSGTGGGASSGTGPDPGTGQGTGGSGGDGSGGSRSDNGGSSSNGGGSNNNGGGFPSGNDNMCVPVGGMSNPFMRQLILAGRRPCPVVTLRPLPSSDCVDLSSVSSGVMRQFILMINFPKKACVASLVGTSPAVAQTTAGFIQEEASTVATIATPAVTTTQPPSIVTTEAAPTSSQCVDVSMFPADERPGAVVFLSIYGIRSCPINNSTGNSTATCVDLTGFSDAEKAIILEILKTIPACNETTTTPSPDSGQLTTSMTSPTCIDVSFFPVDEQPGAVTFLSLYGILVCPISNSSSDIRNSTGCVDISGYTEEQKEIIIEIIKPFPPCNETIVTTTTSDQLTATSTTSQPVSCIDVSFFPMEEQPGAVAFLSLYGILVCPITNSSSGLSNATDCVDISGYTEEQKEIIIEIIKPVPPCNESISTTALPLTTSDQLTTTSTAPSPVSCIDISFFPLEEQPGAVAFLSLYGIVVCPVSNSSSDMNNSTQCVDISGYTEAQKEIIIEIIKPAPPCNETVLTTTTSDQLTDTSSTSPPVSCIDVSFFPMEEQPGAVAFLSLYGILVCPITNSSSSLSNSTECVDISGYTEEQKEIIIEIIKPVPPCNETMSTTASDVPASTSTVDTTQSTTTAGVGTTLSNCVDLSSYTDPQVRAQALEFFTLNSYTICPEELPPTTTTTISTTTQRLTSAPTEQQAPCVDVSIFPVNEQPNAVAFLSIYGILACPLTNSSSTSTCIDLTGFSEQEKSIILELVKPIPACNTTVGTSSDTTGTADGSAGDISSDSSDTYTEALAQQTTKATALQTQPPNIPATETSLTTTTATNTEPCVDVSVFPVTEQAGAVAFLSIYGIKTCPLTGSTSDATCIDLTGFSEDEKSVILDVIKPIPACNNSQETTTATVNKFMDPNTLSKLCIDISNFPEEERQGAIIFLSLYEIQICAFESASVNFDVTSGTEADRRVGCSDLGRFSEQQRFVLIKVVDSLSVCNISTDTTMKFEAYAPSSDITTFTGCVNISSVERPDREKLTNFLLLHNQSICEHTTSVTETTSSSPTAPSTTPQPCVEVGIFNEAERSNAVVYLSLYEIKACPFDYQSSMTGGPCVDLSLFSEAQKIIITSITQPYQLCNDTAITPTRADYSTLSPNRVTAATTTHTSTASPEFPAKPSCADLSGYDEAERIKAFEFFELHGIAPCEEIEVSKQPSTISPTSEVVTMATTPRNCVDLSNVVPALRVFMLAINAPMPACHQQSAGFAPGDEAALSSPLAASPLEVFRLTISNSTTATTSSTALCDGCHKVGDFCYNPHPESCSSYLKCFALPNGQAVSDVDTPQVELWTHNVVFCPALTFWSQEKTTCVLPEHSACVKEELCSKLGEETSNRLTSDCSQYIHCDTHGNLSRRCCPPGQVFKDGSCQLGVDSGCPGVCIN